ncbi:MAG: hypothetical protein GW949_08475 [Spirochaetales bacterium]|nr:hypothetical protein [Spirochaetales bacterium]
MSASISYNFQWYESFVNIPLDEASWNSLANSIVHPFFSWSWLRSLELSGSVSPETGWEPSHLVVWKDNRPLAAGIFYQRSTSWGELFFDFGWANAAQQLNLPYYPKMVGTIPATPAEGYNFLYSPHVGPLEKKALEILILEEVEKKAWADGMQQIAYLFLDEGLKQTLERQDYSPWVHHQFRWENVGFENFDSFLGTFTKNQRKNIRKERQAMKDQGIHIDFRSGDQVSVLDWERMYSFYDRTNSQFGPYAARFLNKTFFDLLGGSKPPYIILASARDGSSKEPLAMAFLGRSTEFIYGRYWGMREERTFLHFNLCYYAPQEYAIEEKIPYFDPGVGSFHKVRRGFKSKGVYSAHKFRDPKMTALFKSNIPRLNADALQDLEELNSQMPQKREIINSDGGIE